MISAKQLIQSLLLFVLFISVFSRAEVQETAQMSEALSAVDAKTLLVFDLDNTIIEPVQTLGSDQWFEAQVKHYVVVEHLDPDRAIHKAIILWSKIQQVSGVQPVEKNTPFLIKEKQEQGIRVMGLTARPQELSTRTREQLKSIGVDLSLTAVSTKDFAVQGVSDAKFTRGITFVGTNNKGKVLAALLKQLDLVPAKVVFVDDKEKHVKSVDVALKELGIKYLGFRYGAADEKVKRYETEFAPLAAVQLQFFGKLLTDKAAKAILENDRD